VAGTYVLKPYVRRREIGWFGRFLIFATIVFVAAFYGLMVSILPMQLIAIPAVPLLLLIALLLWMLPDLGAVDVGRMATLMLWFVGLNIMWPIYIAFDVPGLPWITPTRIVVFSLLSLVVFGLATSSEFRASITETLDTVPTIRRLFWIFWGFTTLSLVFSSTLIFSLNKYANNQIFWTMLCCVSALVATRELFVKRMATILVTTTFIVSVIAIHEFSIERIIWIDYLPSFLKVDPDFIEKVGSSQARSSTGIYRARGTMTNSLYFAEYLSLTFPLAIHFIARAKRWRYWTLLALGIFGTMVAMYLTNARSAMIGMLLTFLIYPAVAAWRRRKQNPSSIPAMTTLVAYPVGIVLVSLVVVFWRRAHVAVLGGGQHAASSEAREVQWAMGLPKAVSHPLGHGVSRAGEVLSFANPAGELTIDSYYLSVLLDYGFLALPVFILLFILPAWHAFKVFADARDEQTMLVAPLAIGLLNFIVIKAVLSSEGNMPLAFVFLGCIIGLILRHQRQIAPERVRPSPEGIQQPV
jgi:hypothetical protein